MAATLNGITAIVYCYRIKEGFTPTIYTRREWKTILTNKNK